MKYSIITATRNSAAFIERALASILSQSYPDFEWVIQDGASTDDTLVILQKYPDFRIKINSEPDTGIYDAWNKAVARASGDWAIFIGGDDFFVQEHVLAQCHRHIKKLPEKIEFAYGALLLGSDGRSGSEYNRSLQECYHLFFVDMGILFPATFIRMSLLRQQCFNTSYKIAGDYEFAARCLTRDNVARLPVVVSYMERGGVSDSKGVHKLKLQEERQRVVRECVVPRAQEFAEGCAKYLWDVNTKLERLD